MTGLIGTYVVGISPDRDEERLDRIAERLYGTEQERNVERLLETNNGLAALGPYDPRGTAIDVPALPATTPPNPAYVRPWE